MTTDTPERVRRATIVDPATGDVIREPTVVAAEWIDPDDSNPNRRVAKRVSGWRRADPLANLMARSGLVTRLHIAAAERYRRAYEAGILGAQAARAGDPGVPAGGFDPATSMPTSEMRLAAISRFRRARMFAGGSYPELMDHVVLELGDVASWARRNAFDRKVALGLLLASLDRLVEFFRPDDRRRISDV